MLNQDQSDRIKQTHPILHRVFETHWNTTLQVFAKSLFRLSSQKIEKELLDALKDEWIEMHIHPDVIRKALLQLTQCPVLQTGHHITPTNGPTFLALDLISLSGFVTISLKRALSVA